MQYLLLIYTDEQKEQSMSQEEMGAMFQAYGEYTEALKASGCHVAGQALKPTTTATTVRVRESKNLHTDGPFAETKEQLGGFYMVDCETLDEALEWAAKIPSAKYGSIEVRPIMDI
jgi:hypothetical protein